MVKIATIIYAENVRYNRMDVSFMLDDGTQTAIFEPGQDYVSPADLEAAREELKKLREDWQAQGERDGNLITHLQAEIGNLRQALDQKPAEVREPLMHVEHQDVPTGRTIGMLAPLSALAPHPTLDEPAPPRLEDDPDAPARPPRD